MAKPTTRIPLWASGGTKVDPGASKESAGWQAVERPPAHWFNWILHTIGEWLGYYETVTPYYIGRIRGGATPIVISEAGDTTINTFAPASSDIQIGFSSAISSTSTVVAIVSGANNSHNYYGVWNDATEFELSAFQNSDGAPVNLNSGSPEFNIIIYDLT